MPMNLLAGRSIVLFTVWCSSTTVSIATVCETYKPHERSAEPRICQCGPNLKKLQMHNPFGLKLYAVCDLYYQGQAPINLETQNTPTVHYVNHVYDIPGSFYFKGDSVITGVVKKGQHLNRGDLYFYPNKDNPNFAYDEIGFEDPKADLHFGTANFSWSGNYFCATATMRIKRLYFYEWTSELRGAYALDYEVVRVGKYGECANP